MLIHDRSRIFLSNAKLKEDFLKQALLKSLERLKSQQALLPSEIWPSAISIKNLKIHVQDGLKEVLSFRVKEVFLKSYPCSRILSFG
jgi:hypothetical protein